jgi:hypothetical protein
VVEYLRGAIMILYTLKKSNIDGERQTAFISDIYETLPNLLDEVQTLSIREFEESSLHITRDGFCFNIIACRGYTDAFVSEASTLYDDCKNDVYTEKDNEDCAEDNAYRLKHQFSLIQGRDSCFFPGHAVTNEYKTLRGIEHYTTNALILGSVSKHDFNETIPVNGSIDYGITENNKFIIVKDAEIKEYSVQEFFDVICSEYKEYLDVHDSL